MSVLRGDLRGRTGTGTGTPVAVRAVGRTRRVKPSKQSAGPWRRVQVAFVGDEAVCMGNMPTFVRVPNRQYHTTIQVLEGTGKAVA